MKGLRQRNHLVRAAHDHHVQDCLDGKRAFLEQFEPLELFADKETPARDDPIIRVANQEDLPGLADRDRTHVAEQKVAPAQEITIASEGFEMIPDDLVLNELGVILLLDGHEHSNDVAQQMAAASSARCSKIAVALTAADRICGFPR